MKEFFGIFFTHPVVLSCLFGMVAAQFIKFVSHYVRTKKIDFGVLFFESGGMPSSHSAPVSALSASVYIDQGFSLLFIAVTVFGLIVMRDAAGIRWVSGQQSILLNKIVRSLRKHEISLDYVHELMGHTPTQVLAGAALGIVSAIAIHSLFGLF